MHSATNYLIASQAASDLLYLTVVPVWAANRWLGTWPGGDALCKVCVYAQYVTSTVSIWNMCAIAVERLRSISRNRGTAMSGPQVAVCSAILWVVSLALNVVHTLKTSMQMVRVKGQELRYCEADSVLGAEGDAGRWMTYALSLGSFLGPVGFLVFIYSKIVAMVRLSSMRVRSHVTSARNIRNLRLERRLLLMLVLSALLFFLMWLPSIVANTLVMGDHHHLLTPTVVTVTAAIGAVNMSVNPVLLLYFNNFFRDSEERNARENQASSSREQHDSGGAPPDVRRTDRIQGNDEKAS
nr:hypothetical protein BaRGS_027285 [Batillaria attramentaria]